MTVFKNLDIQTTKNYDNEKTVRRHIGLTPRNAIAIDELKVLHETETGVQLYPSAIINFAMDVLIKTINETDSDNQIDFIMDGVNPYY